MRHPRSGIGFELASVILILGCLAGSMALVVAIHRQNAPHKAEPVAVALAPPPPAPKPAAPAPVPIIDEPESEPAPAPTPVDPTPAVLARLTSAEAEQLLEASKADRRTAALEAARREAMLESERLRRRESLVHAQLSSLDLKVRKLETEADELAFERDALLKERDARKAMAARARSRPATAILPHKGPNGTWRRPIVIECHDGMATIQPQGVSFGLLELDNGGFGPLSNPFTATVAREAIRIQGKATPDGKPVVPYIFFIVRPDGIRPYYEARGRLEALGITFGYELADQDWQIDFPDLDDTASWDGSAPYRSTTEDPMAAPRPSGGGRSHEDDEFPTFTSARGGDGRSSRPMGGPGGDFAWPAASPYLRGTGPGGKSGGTGEADQGPAMAGVSGVDPLGGTTDVGPLEVSSNGPDRVGSGTGTSGKPAVGSGSIAGVGRGTQVRPGQPSTGGTDETMTGFAGGPGNDASARSLVERVFTEGSQLAGPVPNPPSPRSQGDSEPGSDFVWNGKNAAEGKPGRSGQPPSRSLPPAQFGASDALDRSETKAPKGSPGIDPTASPGDVASGSQDSDPTMPGGSGSPTNGQARSTSTQAPSGSTSNSTVDPKGQGSGKTPQRVIGPGTAPPSTMTPPPGMTGLAMTSPPPVLPSPGMPIPVMPETAAGAPKPRSMSMPELPRSIVDRTYEVVVVCGPRGVIVQPGGYRVTVEALKDRDGLLKKQIVALIKARRAADPKVILEPSVRFLIQSGGFETYRAAKGQFLLSGLDYPITTQVADPDPPSILPSEGW